MHDTSLRLLWEIRRRIQSSQSGDSPRPTKSHWTSLVAPLSKMRVQLFSWLIGRRQMIWFNFGFILNCFNFYLFAFISTIHFNPGEGEEEAISPTQCELVTRFLNWQTKCSTILLYSIFANLYEIWYNEKEIAKHPFQQEQLQRVFYSDGAVGDW